MNIDLNEETNNESQYTDEETHSDVKSEGYSTESTTGEANGSDSEGTSEEKREPCPTVDSIASRLAPGSVLDSLDQAYVLYCEYARMLGFSVKKGTQSYFCKTAVIKMKLYHCSCEGQTDCSASYMKVSFYRRQHTRTGCKARLRVVREMDGPWTVSVFCQDHNHELLGPDESYLLRSSRNLTHAKKSVLETLNSAGIGVNQSLRYLEKESSGTQIGFTQINRVSKLQKGDAEAILQFLKEKTENEPYIYWNVLLDKEGRLMNFYFRDCRCAQDYECFGDVMSVDTTFRTNKYNLICAPFVGMNHHREKVMFGLAFLSDESSESFEWLFEAFLESMQGKEPGVIFSDEDRDLMNGIDYAFCKASHRLCQLHINQNALVHFGKLNEVKEFREMWFHCMNGCEDEREFEETWKMMKESYNLQTNEWFNNMYRLRRRWSYVFTNDRFTGGLHAACCETTNRVIKDLCANSTSLPEFMQHYESIIRDWRLRERDQDVLSRGLPCQFIDGNQLLKHAARVYTRNMYRLFEHEAANSINVNISQSVADSVGGDTEFTLSEDNQKTRKVVYNQSTNNVSCTCHLLVTGGTICRHILKVFYTLNVQCLPDKYILSRWTREPKHKHTTSWVAEMCNRGRVPDMIWVNIIMQKVFIIAMECKDVPERRALCMEWITSLEDKFLKMKKPEQNQSSRSLTHKRQGREDNLTIKSNV